MSERPKKRASLWLWPLIAAVCLAALLPPLLFDPPRVEILPAASLSTPAPKKDARAEFLAERERAREAERQALNTLLSGADVPEALRRGAEEMLLLLAKCAENETQIEAALGGMHLTGLSSVSERHAYVFVDQALTGRQAALLFMVVKEITGLSDEDIRVADGNQAA